MAEKGVPPEVAALRGAKRRFFEAWMAARWHVREASHALGISPSRGYYLAAAPEMIAARDAVRSTRISASIMEADELAEMYSEICRTCLSSFIAEDGSVDLEAVKRSGPDLVRYSVVEWPTKSGTARRITIKLENRLAAAKQLAELRGYDAAPAGSDVPFRVEFLPPWDAPPLHD